MAFALSTLLDPIGTAKADIQAYVGEFLQVKAKLQPLTVSSNAQVAQQAQQYMQQQLQLEAQLPTILGVVNNLTAADAFSTNGLQVASFSSSLVSYMGNVKTFLGAGATTATTGILASMGISDTQLVIGGAIAVVGLLMGRTMLGVIGGVGYILASKAGVVNIGV